jgi:hypothetical protein
MALDTPIVPNPPPAPGAGEHSPIAATLGNVVASAMSSALDAMMRSVWSACLDVLQAVFGLVDHFSVFTFTTSTAGVAGPGPAGASVVALGSIWPTLMWLSGVIAFGLFLWQLTVSAARGGRGMWHAATGPVAYGIALAVSVGAVAAVLELGDGLTTAILAGGLNAHNFAATWTHLPFSTAQGVDGVKAIVLGLAGLFAVLVAFGYAIEIIWRQAAILVLVATIPISAAGLLAQSTASWYWRTARWTLAAIAMKPLLALTVVIGVATLAGQTGVMGLLAGIAVLAVSLLCPFALFRLFAFVDPTTHAGAGMREAFSGIASRLQSGLAGIADTAGFFGGGAPSGASGGSDRGSGGVGAIEAANTSRFDTATPPTPTDTSTRPTSTGPARSSAGGAAGEGGGGSASSDTTTGIPASPGQPGDAAAPPPAAGTVTAVAPSQGPAGGTYGGAAGPETEPPPAQPPSPDLGPSGATPTPRSTGPATGPRPGGGGGGSAGGGSATEVEEAAVIL